MFCSAGGSLPCVQTFEQCGCPNCYYVACVAISAELKKPVRLTRYVGISGLFLFSADNMNMKMFGTLYMDVYVNVDVSEAVISQIL